MGRTPINKPGGWWGPGGGLELALVDGFNPGYVKCGMDLHRPGQVKTDSSRVDDLGDREWSHKPRSQLPRLHPERKVPSRQPHPLAGSVVRRRGAVSVGPPLVPVRSAQECRAGLQPGPTTALYKYLDRWDPGLPLLYRAEWGLVSSGALKR